MMSATLDGFQAQIVDAMPKTWDDITGGGSSVMRPLWHVVFPSGEQTVAILDVPYEERHRGALAICLTFAGRVPRPIGLCVTMEAWAADQVRGSKLAPGQREDRREIVLAQFQLEGRPDRLVIWPVERDESGARLGRSEETEPLHSAMLPIRVCGE